MKMTFAELKLNQSLVLALAAQGIVAPTPVQQKAIPEVLANKDVAVESKTGTGKTLAYVLPLFEKLDATLRAMQALILAPTHELAMQILKQIELLSATSEIKLTSAPVIGNVNIERQIERLREKPHLLVGTPGRVLELITRRKITAHTLKIIVIDEADNLLSEDNIAAVTAIVRATQRDRQLLMFSASITKHAETEASKLMKEPLFIRETARPEVPSSIEHMYFVADERAKFELLRKAIVALRPARAIIFVGDRDDTAIIVDKLNYHGHRAAGMHGHSDKTARKAVLEAFRAGGIDLLVVSDLAARGLDILGVTHIFNLHMPEKSRAYLHRAGRTGRMGQHGTTVSFATERETELIPQYERELGIHISRRELFRGEVVAEGRRAATHQKTPRRAKSAVKRIGSPRVE
ncbi:MAG: DEAD-box ATP-dependent RNA helicase CshC [Firmicutes bacterium]|nr:DEAD-box ATP-dependent RNA helicase CshC [candidate division NPL-UPA2 bacterium]MBT9154446.1 DEAD-box ATP-dependent RNA helicase CshC [candidate division NPL-UPA2 bacterium]